MELILAQKREQQKRSTSQLKEFTSALDLINEEQWKKNQTVAHNRRAREERFNKIATQRRAYLKSVSENSIRDAVLTSIDDFDRRLESDIYRDDSSLKQTVGKALKKLSIEDPGAKLVETTFLDKNVLQSSMQLARKSLKERNDDNRAKESTKDKRRRKFLGEREISHRISLKQAAASDIMNQLLNPSQSEIFEEQFFSRVQLQRELITENRYNRDHLIATLNEAESVRMEIWKKEETAREIEWVIENRIAAQFEKFKELEEAQYAADTKKKLLASTAISMRVKKVAAWVDSCDQLGLFPSTGSVPLKFLLPSRDSAPDTTHDDVNLTTPSKGGIRPSPHSIFWNDAKIMFASHLEITKALPSVNNVKIFEDLPFSLSEELSHVDSQWLLSKPFRTHDVMPAVDSLSLLLNSVVDEVNSQKTKSLESRKVSFPNREESLAATEYSSLGSTLPTDNRISFFDKTKDVWGTDPVREVSEHLAVYDLNSFIFKIGNAKIPGGYHRAPSIPIQVPVDAVSVLTSASKGRGSATPVADEEPPSDPAMEVKAPSWLLTTPSKYLLGEIIVAVRCAAEIEVESSPSEVLDPALGSVIAETALAVAVANDSRLDSSRPPVDGPAAAPAHARVHSVVISKRNSFNQYHCSPIPIFPVRLAVCGVSDLAKKAVAQAVCALSNGSVRAISVDHLLRQAIDFATRLDGMTKSPTTRDDHDIFPVMGVGVGREMDGGREFDRQQLALRALSILQAGEVIPDDVYVSLVVQAVRDLGDEQKEALSAETPRDETEARAAPIQGFLLDDFPNTKQQAAMLVTALSGIDYDSRKPQPLDKSSPFAPMSPSEVATHDIALCGLDTILFLEQEREVPLALQSRLSEILCARTNIDTKEIVYLPASIKRDKHTVENVDSLEEVHESVISRHTAVLDIALTNVGAEELKTFLNKIGVLRTVASSTYGSLKEFAAVAAEMIYNPPKIEEEVNVQDAPVGSMSCKSAVFAALESEPSRRLPSNLTVECDDMESSVDGLPSPRPPPPPPPAMFTKISVELARALSGMWLAAENQSIDAGRSFFKSLRDSRYQMVQRRRALHDSLSVLLTRLDCRQELFDEFVTGFNQIDDDFRFDPDCVAELHLRSLELRETLLTGCDVRKKEAETFVAKAAVDGICPLLVHLSECEGAAMLQAEYNRFIVSLHLLLDYTKAMATYDRTKKAVNTLEETLIAVMSEDPSSSNIKADGRRVILSAAGAPKKPPGMHRKGSAVLSLDPEAYRVPIPVISLPMSMMSDIPKPAILADSAEDDSKAPTAKSVRGKSDGKSNRGSRPETASSRGEDKGMKSPQGPIGPGPGSGPLQMPGSGSFQVMEAAVLELAVFWGKENFKVNSILYDKDRTLCNALETAVWHECERLRLSVCAVKGIVEKQTAWLSEAESSLQSIFLKKIAERYEKECSSAERLIVMVGERIDAAESVKHQWLLAPDVIAVAKNVLLIHPEPSAVIPTIEKYHTDKLNDRQMKMLDDWVDSVSLGGVVLEQDLQSLLDRGLNPIGPFGTKTLIPEGASRHLTFPKLWRDLGSTHSSSRHQAADSGKELEYSEGIRKYLFSRDKVNGVDEHSGTVYVDSVLNILGGKLP